LATSIRDVAARAGVSVGTVSNVLNQPDRVNNSTRRKVLDAVHELGYVRNDAARQLRAGVSTTVGLVVLDITNPFFAELARGAQEEATRRGLSLLIGSSDGLTEREQSYVDTFEQHRVRGILLSPTGEPIERMLQLDGRGIGTVLVDRAAAGTGIDSVSVDDVAGGAVAAQHLIDSGCRRIAFVGPISSAVRQVVDRLAGASDAAREAGATLEVIDSRGLTVTEGRDVGRLIAERAPSARPDGVFAANDLLAVGVLQAFLMDGTVQVPDDVSLIGYDDIDFAASTIVPLSSVSQPAALIGRTAIELLMSEQPGGHNRTSGERSVVFQPELVVRRSTARSGSTSSVDSAPTLR
jgi:LacI family transcriptional regulator